MKNSRTRILTATFSAALLMSSSLAMAGKHGNDQQHGEHKRANMAKACEQLRAGNMPSRHQQHMAKMEEHHQAMAERLKLNDEQRQIWNEIQQERKNKISEKSEKWQEKMEKRCEKRAKKE